MQEENVQKAAIREKLTALRELLKGIEAPIAELAAGAFRAEGVPSTGDGGFINHFKDSFTDGGSWYDTFADAPGADITALSIVAASEARDMTLSVLSEPALNNITLSVVAKTPSES